MSQNVQQPNSHLFLKALLLNTALYQGANQGMRKEKKKTGQ
jgi:hypothetical protein